jgi:hypothetical protein
MKCHVLMASMRDRYGVFPGARLAAANGLLFTRGRAPFRRMNHVSPDRQPVPFASGASSEADHDVARNEHGQIRGRIECGRRGRS